MDVRETELETINSTKNAENLPCDFPDSLDENGHLIATPDGLNYEKIFTQINLVPPWCINNQYCDSLGLLRGNFGGGMIPRNIYKYVIPSTGEFIRINGFDSRNFKQPIFSAQIYSHENKLLFVMENIVNGCAESSINIAFSIINEIAKFSPTKLRGGINVIKGSFKSILVKDEDKYREFVL